MICRATSGSGRMPLSVARSRSTTAIGVPAGTEITPQPAASKPPTPSSASVGMSGAEGRRTEVETPSARHLAFSDLRQRGHHIVHHLDAGHALEHLGLQVMGRAGAARSIGKPARVLPGILHELGNAVHRERSAACHDQGVTVRGRFRARGRPDHGSRAGPVLHHHRFAQPVGEIGCEQPAERIDGAARRPRRDQRDLARGIFLRAGHPNVLRAKHQHRNQQQDRTLHGVILKESPQTASSATGGDKSFKSGQTRFRFDRSSEKNAIL